MFLVLNIRPFHTYTVHPGHLLHVNTNGDRNSGHFPPQDKSNIPGNIAGTAVVSHTLLHLPSSVLVAPSETDFKHTCCNNSNLFHILGFSPGSSFIWWRTHSSVAAIEIRGCSKRVARGMYFAANLMFTQRQEKKRRDGAGIIVLLWWATIASVWFIFGGTAVVLQ